MSRSDLGGLPVAVLLRKLTAGNVTSHEGWPAPSWEEAHEDADAACVRVCKDAQPVDVVVLLADAKTRLVTEFMVTFVCDPDSPPWWSHRTCSPTPLDDFFPTRVPHNPDEWNRPKVDAWDMDHEDVLGNYEPEPTEAAR